MRIIVNIIIVAFNRKEKRKESDAVAPPINIFRKSHKDKMNSMAKFTIQALVFTAAFAAVFADDGNILSKMNSIYFNEL